MPGFKIPTGYTRLISAFILLFNTHLPSAYYFPGTQTVLSRGGQKPIPGSEAPKQELTLQVVGNSGRLCALGPAGQGMLPEDSLLPQAERMSSLSGTQG